MGNVVSVVVPCYNYGAFLPQCVRNIVAQDGVEVRVLIVDDASTDDTPEQAQRLVGSHPNVFYVRNPVNLGHIATYNEGLDWVDGEFATLISADDLLTPGSLSRAVAVLQDNPSVGLVYGGVRQLRSGVVPPARNPAGTGRYVITPGHQWIEDRCRDGVNPITTPEAVFRTDVLRQVGGYRPELPRTGDRELWLRMAAVSDVARLRDADQAYYRIHEQNMHITKLTSWLDIMSQRKAAFDWFFAEAPVDVPDAGRLQRLADRRLALMALRHASESLENPARRSEAEALMDFAGQIWPDVRRLPPYWGFRWRQRVGPGGARLTRQVADLLSARRTRLWLSHQRRLRHA